MKITQLLSVLSAGLAITFAACEKRTVVVVEPTSPDPVSKTRTFETTALKSAIDTYEKSPTAENAAEVREAFAELDKEIAELQGDVAKKEGDDRAEAAQKLANLTAYRNAETARFANAQAGPKEIRVDPRPAAEKVEDAARRTGETLKDAAKEVGEAIKDIGR